MYRGQVQHLNRLLSQYPHHELSFEGLEVDGKMTEVDLEGAIQVRQSASFNALMDLVEQSIWVS